MTPIPAPEYLRSHPIFQPYWKHEEQARKEFEDFWTGWCIKNEQWKLKAEFELQVRGATLEFVLRGRGCRNDDRKYCDNIMEGFEGVFARLNGPTDGKTTVIRYSRSGLYKTLCNSVSARLKWYLENGVATVQYWHERESDGYTRPWLIFVLAESSNDIIVYVFP